MPEDNADEIQEILSEVPADYRERFLEIIQLIDTFCDTHLNEEYKFVARRMAGSMCQEGAPVLRGKAASWACGIMYSVGWVNFLTDADQNPHMKSEEIAAGFGISPATMYAKHRTILTGLDLMPLDPSFTIASRMDDNPLVWMLSVNGVVMDIRDAPREAQIVAYEQGLIPYIPADQAEGE